MDLRCSASCFSWLLPIAFGFVPFTLHQVKPTPDGIEGYIVLPERLTASAIFWSITPHSSVGATMAAASNKKPRVQAGAAAANVSTGYRHHFRLTTVEDMTAAFRAALQQAYSYASQR